MIKIKNMELQNFRQFRGRQEISFSDKKNKTFTIVEGPNGAGKTTLMNAILWCLYGKEESFRNEKEKGMGILNDKRWHEMKKGSVVRVSVKLLVEKDGMNYSIERSADCSLSSSGRKSIDLHPLSVSYEEGDGDFKPHHDPEAVPGVILPESVKDFFFFDGERMDEFFKEKGSEVVKDAIFKVSKLALLEKAISHLDSYLDSVRRSVKIYTPQAELIMQKIETYKKSKSDLEEDMESFQNDKKSIQSNIRDIEEKQSKSNVEVVEQLSIRRSEIESHNDQLRITKEETDSRLVEQVNKIAPAVYCLPAIKHTLNIMEKEISLGTFPPGVKETFVKELIKRGLCICGTDLSKKREAVARLKSLIENVRPLSKMSDRVNDGKYKIGYMIDDVKTFVASRDDLVKESIRIESVMTKNAADLEDISKKIGGSDSEKIVDMEKSRRRLSDELGNLNMRIGDSRSRIDYLSENIDRSEKDYEKEIEKSGRHKDELDKLKLGEEALKILTSVRARMMDKIRNNIESKTNSYFLSFIWKKNAFEKVTINEDYVISVYNKFGTEALGKLSAGEREVLALSFLAALRDVSGFEAPIFIDTPLSRISGKPRENIARLLPEYLEDTQVCLFVTDQEYTDSVRRTLSKNVGRYYMLEFDEGNMSTEVMKSG